MAKKSAKTTEKKTPAWKQAQQKQTKPEKAKERSEVVGKPNNRMIKMRTSYRHFAKAGDVWETDESKAAELVRLGRAEYVEEKKGK